MHFTTLGETYRIDFNHLSETVLYLKTRKNSTTLIVVVCQSVKRVAGSISAIIKLGEAASQKSFSSGS